MVVPEGIAPPLVDVKVVDVPPGQAAELEPKQKAYPVLGA